FFHRSLTAERKTAVEQTGRMRAITQTERTHTTRRTSTRPRPCTLTHTPLTHTTRRTSTRTRPTHYLSHTLTHTHPSYTHHTHALTPPHTLTLTHHACYLTNKTH